VRNVVIYNKFKNFGKLVKNSYGPIIFNNNNNNNNNKVIIKITTDFIFMTVFPEIFRSSHEIIFICEEESAPEGELSEVRFMTPPQ
jgi:hypothetical protein